MTAICAIAPPGSYREVTNDVFRRKPQFHVPERRKHIRILTIRNFAGFVAAIVFVVLAINALSELRAPHSDGYGRLFSKERPDEITPRPAPQVVHEAPVADNERADPMLIAPMARAQYLSDPQLTPKINAAQTVDVPKPPAGDPAKVVIVGGANGVNIVHPPTAATPKLTGGIFNN
jgi:hypothetical protein